MKRLITNIFLMLLAMSASAQTATLKVMNGAELKCNTPIVVHGSIENNGGFENNDEISLDGDFISNNLYSGAGIMNFRGSGSSSLSCTNDIQHLWLNKSINGELILNSDVQVIESIIMNYGNINLNNSAIHHGTNLNSSWLTGGSNNSYMYGNGAYRRYLVFPEIYSFPFGTDGNYTPALISLEFASLNNAWIEGGINPVEHPNLPTTGSQINRYWSFETQGISAAQYDCILSYASDDVVGYEGELTPYIWTGVQWTGPTGSGTPTESGVAQVYPSMNEIHYYDFNELSDITAFSASFGCPGDFNGDNLVNTSDLLQFLGEFGCDTNCTADLNGDGVVNTADLLVLLSLFGSDCNP